MRLSNFISKPHNLAAKSEVFQTIAKCTINGFVYRPQALALLRTKKWEHCREELSHVSIDNNVTESIRWNVKCRDNNF